MALSANMTPVIRDCESFPGATMAIAVKSASVLYNGALCMFDAAYGGGPITPFDGTLTKPLAGWHFGDSATGVAALTVDGSIHPGGFVWEGLTVAGIGNASTDLGKRVYATDDGTYNIVDTGAAVWVGNIIRSRTATTCDVHMRIVFGHTDTPQPTPTPSPTPTPTPTPT